MFGRNPLRKREVDTSGLVLMLQGQPFLTIQGEGPHAGRPATFVRLWGCHLACSFCDTDFESDMRLTPITEIEEYCHGTKLVVLTGGEPLRQNVVPLVALLGERGYRTQIETAGSFWPVPWPDHLSTAGMQVDIVVSPKTPFVDEHVGDNALAWKYIISAAREVNPDDGLPAHDMQGGKYPLARPPKGTPPQFVYVQPMDEYNDAANIANRDLCVALAKRYGYRLSLQLHKILGVP